MVFAVVQGGQCFMQFLSCCCKFSSWSTPEPPALGPSKQEEEKAAQGVAWLELYQARPPYLGT